MLVGCELVACCFIVHYDGYWKWNNCNYLRKSWI